MIELAIMKIESFRHKGLRAFAKTGSVAGILPSHASRLRECLELLATARSIDELTREAHPMTRGSALSGLWAMKVSAQWRLVFRMLTENSCSDMDYQNYH